MSDPPWRVVATAPARREFDRLPISVAAAVLETLDSIAEKPKTARQAADALRARRPLLSQTRAVSDRRRDRRRQASRARDRHRSTPRRSIAAADAPDPVAACDLGRRARYIPTCRAERRPDLSPARRTSAILVAVFSSTGSYAAPRRFIDGFYTPRSASAQHSPHAPPWPTRRCAGLQACKREMDPSGWPHRGCHRGVPGIGRGS